MNSLKRTAAARCALIVLPAMAALAAGSGMAANLSTKTATDVPDLSGWWFSQLPFSGGGANAGRPPGGTARPATAFGRMPFKPEYAQLAQKYAAMELEGSAERVPGYKPYRTCGQFRFTGTFHVDAEAGIEFLMTPGRVTITDEGGQLRRIYLDGKIPADVDETFGGTSVGHWEGKTLVIETAGLKRTNYFEVIGGRIPIGKGVHSTERISLVEPGLIRIESVVVAPDALTAPHKATATLRRVPNYVPHEFAYCDDNDKYLNPDTGEIFFDMKAPEDLPPPPPTRQ